MRRSSAAFKRFWWTSPRSRRPAPDPAQDRARGGEEREGRSFAEAPGADRGRDQEARARIRRPGGSVEGGEVAGRRLPARERGAGEAQARDGGRQEKRRLAESVRAPVRPHPPARSAAEKGREG